MVEWNRDTPWRQGLLLDSNAIGNLELAHPASPDQTLVVVASHDCDLAQAPEGEPIVEVVVGRFLTDKDGNCTHAKNARKLHIEFAGATNFWAEFEATSKVPIDKLRLNDFAPRKDAVMLPENLAVFQMWLASRYRRSAFPDEFEHRLKDTKLAEKITKIVKPHGELIVGVFFEVDGGIEVARNGADDTYTLDITIMHAAEPDFNAAEQVATVAVKDIELAFKQKLFQPTKKWQHIELRFCEAVSETVLTYQAFKQMKRWRLEHISLGAVPQQPVLAE
jgi:hypothetical protein